MNLPASTRPAPRVHEAYERESLLVPLLTSGRAIGFFAHFIAYVFTCLIVLVAAGVFPTLMVGLGWGIGLALHGFFVLLVPLMRMARSEDTELEAWSPPHEAERVPAPLAAAAESPLMPKDRARSLEELSAAIAHEIRNPITAAKSLVQQIAEDPSAEENREHARVAVEELDRVERSIAHLLRFAREEPFEPGPVDVSALIESAVELLRDRAERQAVQIERDIERVPSAYADGEQLRKVLANLIGNALDAHAERPTTDAWIRIAAGRNLAGDELWIRVRDNGPGLNDVQRQQAFQPFRTTKPGGTGLGLALARKVLARHGGSVELVQAKQPGAEFLLVLPLRAATTESGR
jgi:signal transduction histidine kinase